MSNTLPMPRAVFGWSGFAIGAVALVLALAALWAGPFAPQQSAGATLGELAADIAKSAMRSAAGKPQPEPVAAVRDIDDYIRLAVGALAGLAIILGVAAFVRHEHKRAAVSGIALGGLAITVQLFAYTVMMIAGALVLGALLLSMRDTFSGIFGGFFGE